MYLERYLKIPVARDLRGKMVFVAGPRQVGKTTFAKQLMEAGAPGVYYSWDRREDRREILKAQWPAGESLVVLDELHKYRHWKRWIKGEFDKYRDRLKFLVTGSARLDIYRRGCDSLQGRYHHYRLHPFSFAEIERSSRKDYPVPGQELAFQERGSRTTLDSLMQFGGFPEPFLAQSERSLRRWQKERLDRFFREDVRDLNTIHDLSSMELLSDLLIERVGSPLSVNSLREDLEVSHRAVTHWIDVLEHLYFAFRVTPFTARLIRGLKKRAKHYLWDSSLVRDTGARFENLVAGHLLKFCHFLEDTEGYRMELCHLRDAAGREVDFLVVCDRRPWFAVEAKLKDCEIGPHLHYFRERLGIPWAYQVVLEGRMDFIKRGVRCLPAHTFLSALV